MFRLRELRDMFSQPPYLLVLEAETFPWVRMLQSRPYAGPSPTHMVPGALGTHFQHQWLLLAVPVNQGFMTALGARPALNVWTKQLIKKHVTAGQFLFKPSVSPLHPMNKTSGFAAEKSTQDLHFGDPLAYGGGW